jgi:3-oxosteroid 1-dehydrogenase
LLGEAFWYLREPSLAFRLLNRYSLDLTESFTLSARPPGWRRIAARILIRYWCDLGWRLKTGRDRRLTMGNALIGSLCKAMLERGVPVALRTSLTGLLVEDGRVSSVEVLHNEQPISVKARRAVVLSAGGIEQSQALRDRYMPVPTRVAWSLTPKEGNSGDALIAAQAAGAATEFLDCAWWAPSMQLPSIEDSNVDVTHQMFFDHRHPNSVCVNRLGRRFVNESCPYDLFGIAMIEDQRRTGANTPCWFVFDADYRSKYTAGGILPSTVTPDRRIPQEWWDTYIYRADSIAELAAKIGIDPEALTNTVENMNRFARSGVDDEFGRGSGAYDRYFGDPRSQPNPCLGSIERPPYYAVRIDLGDLGSKGGLKADAAARVLRDDGSTIEGLYAVGNSAGSPFGDCYPGSGGTLGPATVFAFVAANDIANRAM